MVAAQNDESLPGLLVAMWGRGMARDIVAHEREQAAAFQRGREFAPPQIPSRQALWPRTGVVAAQNDMRLPGLLVAMRSCSMGRM